ncbi:Disease resistance protein RPP13 [Euphorbia peplus]|nr:Disease resistance protein RPP13 [Euphorbia peplus]
MAGEVAVDILAAKLKALLNEKQLLSAGSTRKVKTFLTELDNSRTALKQGDEEAITSPQLNSSFTQKLSFVYEVDDMIDTFAPETSATRFMSGFNFNRKAKQILSRYNVKNEVQDAPSENVGSGNNSHPSESTSHEGTDRWERIAARAEDSANITGLDDQKEELRELILKNSWSSPVIAVVGEAGSGKTRLVKSVFDSVEIKKEFECRAWITVSDKFDKRDVLINLLRQISVVREEQKLEFVELQNRVVNYLKPRSFLLVLDDIKSAGVWNELKRAFPNTVYAGRVILTMQHMKVARSLDSQSRLFQIRPLNPGEALILFKKALEKSHEDDVLTEIVEKCNGLPLAIVTLAGLLSAKPIDEWSSWVKLKIAGTLSEQANILFLSYQALPSSLKPFLLYFGIFPKSYKIPIRRLFRLWLAEGLATKKVVAEDLLEKNFEQLVRTNLIVVAKRRFGSPKTCMAQPALHDSLFRVAAWTGFFHVQPNDHVDVQNVEGKQECNVVRRLVQHLDMSSNPKYQHQHMRSYISFNKHKGDAPADEVDKLLKQITHASSFVLLIVLDLENVYKPVLSETLGKLVRLKYLGLRWTFLDSIPESVGKLTCLETLDVKHTNIPSLPNSIWKAKELRHLYMNEIHFHISKKMGDFHLPSSELQTLWGLLVGKDFSAMLIWLKQLSNLRKLGLTCLDSSVKDIVDWIRSLEHLQSLRLRSVNKYNEPSNLILPTLKKPDQLHELHLFGILKDKFEGLAMLENLKVLTLSVSQREDDPMPVLGRLAQLNNLRLFARSYIGTKMDCLRSGFPKLRVLKLWVLEKLEEWVVEEESMVELGELEIRCCEKLEWPSGLQHLSKSLKELNLTNMPEKFVEDARANIPENVLLVINPKKLEIPPLPGRKP